MPEPLKLVYFARQSFKNAIFFLRVATYFLKASTSVLFLYMKRSG